MISESHVWLGLCWGSGRSGHVYEVQNWKNRSMYFSVFSASLFVCFSFFSFSNSSGLHWNLTEMTSKKHLIWFNSPVFTSVKTLWGEKLFKEQQKNINARLQRNAVWNFFECAMAIIMDVWCDTACAISISEEEPREKSCMLSVYKLFLHDFGIFTSVNIFWRGVQRMPLLAIVHILQHV